MNQFTKSVVIVSTLLAALVELDLAALPVYPAVVVIAIAGFLVAAIAGAWWPGVVSSVVLLAPYLTPAAYVLLTGTEHFSLEIVWALPLLGLAIAGRDAWRWHLPARWQWPLVAWGLIVAVSWPLVFLREIDFDLALLPMGRVANTSVGVTPGDAALNVAYFAMGHNIGILWVDALFRWFDGERRDLLRRHVLLPLAAGCLIASAVGMYQGFVDMSFLGVHLWAYMGRAAGTLADANSFGIIAALWAPAFVVLARSLMRPWSVAVAVGGVLLAGTGVYTSGSRTALMVLAAGLAAMAYEGWRHWRLASNSSRRTALSWQSVSIAIALLVFVSLAILITQGSATTSVIARGGLLPGINELGLRGSIVQFWDRFGYGSTAVDMIREHPLAGVGVGGFHTLVHDYGTLRGNDIPLDNAQNWYRHLMAEFGVLGSVPWIVWCLVLLGLLFSGSASDRDPVAARLLRAPILAFGLVSLLGVPGQTLPVILTFWVLVFWLVSLKSPDVTAERGSWRAVTWGATAALVIAHATLTLAAARGDLLPRNRAMRFGWDYRYGISNLEPNADGGPGRRWTDLKSLSVIPVKGNVLKLVAWVDHPDADERPVHVRIWIDSVLVHEGDLKRSASIAIDVPAAPGKTHMVVETEISRTWRPTDFGRDDRRVLGLSVRDWVWE